MNILANPVQEDGLSAMGPSGPERPRFLGEMSTGGWTPALFRPLSAHLHCYFLQLLEVLQSLTKQLNILSPVKLQSCLLGLSQLPWTPISAGALLPGPWGGGAGRAAPNGGRRPWDRGWPAWYLSSLKNAPVKMYVTPDLATIFPLLLSLPSHCCRRGWLWGLRRGKGVWGLTVWQHSGKRETKCRASWWSLQWR